MASDIRNDAPASAARDADTRAEASGRAGEGTVIARTVTINRPRDEVYAFWREFSNLPRVMENVERIDIIDGRRSHWIVKAPAGKTAEWESLVTEDIPGRLIAWQSVEGADVKSSGRIEFLDAAPGRGSIVRATFSYDPPAGWAGEWIAKLFQREPNVQARRDLRRLKQFLETGEVTSSAGPSGRDEDPTEQHL
jgi:uncharacterized membrane protein